MDKRDGEGPDRRPSQKGAPCLLAKTKTAAWRYAKEAVVNVQLYIYICIKNSVYFYAYLCSAQCLVWLVEWIRTDQADMGALTGSKISDICTHLVHSGSGSG